MSWHAGSYHVRTVDFGPEPDGEAPRRPRRNWGKLGLLAKLLVVLAIVAGGAWLFQSPVFAVSAVQVQGLQHRTEADVLSKVSLLGQNVLTIPVTSVQDALIEDPWLRHVDVQRHLPNKITLHIEERVPVAVWDGKGGRFLVDRDGTLLDPAPATSALPAIKDIDGTFHQVGERVDGDIAELAAKLVESLPKAIGQSAKSFEYLSYGGLVVETDKGKRARFGDGADFDYKLAVWKALLQKGDTDKLKVGHVDLRFGDRPFFRDK